MKKTIWYILIATYIIVCIFFTILLFEGGIVGIDIFMSLFMIFGLSILLFAFFTLPSRINQDLISYEKKEDFILVNYQDYSIRVKKNDETSKFDIPKYDVNNNKIGFLFRETLRNYLVTQYDYLSLPKDIVPVEPVDLKKYFKDLKLCDDSDKKMFIDRRHFKLLYLAIFVLIIINFKYIIEAVATQTISPGMLIFIGLLIFIMVMNYIHENKEKKQEFNGELYSCKVNVYDSKIESDGDAGYYYSVRVCNDDKHVLMNWFSVDKRFYENGKSGTLYLLISGDKYDVEFEKGED